MYVKKSVEAASHFKELGNSYFKQYERTKALTCYTKAIMLCPYTLKVLQESLSEVNQSLEASKRVIADRFQDYVTADTNHSDLLPKCYGNRSAVLCELEKYEECLLDIKRALELGLPSCQAAKLHKRKAKCQQKLAELSKSTNLSRDPGKTRDSSIKCTSEAGCQSVSHWVSAGVSWSETKGRHIVASKDLVAGTVVLTEEPFSAVLEENCASTHCSFCFKDCSFISLPCMTCALEGYCSSECRKQAWLCYHWLECSQASWRTVATWMEVMCLRTVATASGGAIWRHLTREKVDDSTGGRYKSVCELEAHQGRFSSSNEEKMLKKMADNLVSHFKSMILEYAWPSSQIPEPVPSSDSELASRLESAFLLHLLQLRCNTHVVNHLCDERKVDLIGDDELEQSLKSTCGEEDGEGLAPRVEEVEEKRLGRVLLPTASLMNHSCVPNAFFRFTGNLVQVCATKFIKKGQEICTSYGPVMGRHKLLQRRRVLCEKFFFQCDCDACLSLNPELVLAEAALEGLACMECDSGALECQVVSESPTPIWTCCACRTKTLLTSEKLQRNIKMKERAEDLFEKASNTGDLDQLLQCYELQRHVLHRHSAALSATCDRLAQEYAIRGEFHVASDYLRLSCTSVGARYGLHSIEYGSECHKLAGVLLHSGQLKSASEAALKAKEILKVFKGPLSTEYLEVCDMLDFLSSSM